MIVRKLPFVQAPYFEACLLSSALRFTEEGYSKAASSTLVIYFEQALRIHQNSIMGSTGDQYHALVFGASGITGWAIVNAILNGYPSESAFTKVTALTNRPLPVDIAQWPESGKLQVVSGLDLLAGDQSTLEATLKERVSGIETVSHVFFFAYVMDAEPAQEISINVDLLRRAVTAIEHLSHLLKFVVLPTGTKVSASPERTRVQLTSGRHMVSISSISSPGRTRPH